jgi:hypothetical protein
VTPARHAQVRALFAAALRWAPAERDAAVAALAGEDRELAIEVRSLLRHVAPAAGGSAAAGAAAGATAEATIGATARGSARVAAARTTGATGPAGTTGPAGAAGTTDAAGAGGDREHGATLGELAGAVEEAHALGRAIARLAPAVTALLAEEARASRGAVAGSSDDDDDADEGAPWTLATAVLAAPEELVPALGPRGSWTEVHAVARLLLSLLRGRALRDGATVAGELARATCDEPPRIDVALTPRAHAVLTAALARRPFERTQNLARFWAQLTAASEAEAQAQAGTRPPLEAGRDRLAAAAAASPGRAASRGARFAAAASTASTAAVALVAVAAVAAVAALALARC